MNNSAFGYPFDILKVKDSAIKEPFNTFMRNFQRPFLSLSLSENKYKKNGHIHLSVMLI